MAQGWISIHRCIWDSWVWKDKPFSKGQAWIDLLLMANHEDKKTLLGNQLILVERGSRITSIRQLCDRWGWSNTKVNSFLKLLQDDGMITVKSDAKKTIINIVKYSDYQDVNVGKNDAETTVDFSKIKNRCEKNDAEKTVVSIDTTRLDDNRKSKKRHKNDTETTQKHTNNNVNNENNINKDIYSGRRDVFEHYLSLNLIKHKKYTPAMDMAIKTAMKNNGYTIEDCKELLNRHKQAVEVTKDSQYPIKPRPLHEFFGQKVYGGKHLICADYEEGGKYYNITPQQDEPQPHYFKRFEDYEYED